MSNQKPLAEILRPYKLDDYVGQEHLIGENGVIRKAIASGKIPSMILWGPPGVGKTTLANIISTQLLKPFYTLSAVSSGVKDVRDVIEASKKHNGQAILFIDEIHRFSKSQQDSLLGAVEKGIVTLIGATTENPSFEVISPLLSRCQVYVLHNLERHHLELLIKKGIQKIEKDKNFTIDIVENEALLKTSGGDARKLLNALEIVADTLNPEHNRITNKIVTEVIQQNIALYDKSGEMHYDIISAFIKSVRGSDPNAAVYWLARMIDAGEDPKFIARRLIILASEDIGNANPNALLLATQCFQAVQMIGYPECRIVLSQTTIYLATSPKSNASYLAINDAQQLVKKTGDLPVPMHLRNAPTKLMRDLGYGDDYKYAHDYPGNFAELEFLPDTISNTCLYKPGSNPKEDEIRKRMRSLWKNKYGY